MYLHKLISLRNYGTMAAWTMILSDTFQVWQKHQDSSNIYSVHPQRVYSSPNWSDLRTFEFDMLLTADTATNFNNMHLCKTLQIKKSQTRLTI